MSRNRIRVDSRAFAVDLNCHAVAPSTLHCRKFMGGTSKYRMMNPESVPARTDGALHIPARLYGRQQALCVLTSAFTGVCQGRGTVLLVPGNSGSGKTSLVREIRGEVETRNGFFLEGKFDQYFQNIPYYAFRSALSAFCREVSRNERAMNESWRGRLRDAVRGLGRLLIDLVPDLAPLLGEQPLVPEISPIEARHRFAGVLRQFLQVLCRPEHPLVLFLDDMQWADAASVELLARLQVGSTLRYLLVIGSYRDEEVHEGHPLVAAMEELRRQSVPIEVLAIGNLTREEVRKLLEDTLRPAAEPLESLAALLHQRTAGNPFFTRALLASLHEEGLVWFDTACGGWRWRGADLGPEYLPATVVRLFAERLRHLAPETLDLLSLAACLGNQFELEMLAVIGERSAAECRRLLMPAVAAGLVIHLEPVLAPDEYRFLHDRVQQAAYDLTPHGERPQRHLGIGRLLRTRLSAGQLSARLFEVAEHLNAGLDLIEDEAERVGMVCLNTRAARKARNATAYGAALQFHRAASHWLEHPGFAERLWVEHHDAALRLFVDRAESEFVEGDRKVAEQCLRTAVAHAASAIERAESFNTLIVQYTLLARYPEAIAAGREALAALGIRLPETDYEAARDAELAAVREGLQGRSVEGLAGLPVMTHPKMRAAVQILITMGPPCYRSHQRLWSVVVAKVVNLTIQYGVLPQIGYSYPAFGGLIAWVANDYATTKAFGALATRLMTGTFESPSDRSVFYLMIGSSVRHWSAPLAASSRDYAQAYEIGLASGNLQYAAYAFGHNMYCRLYQGTPLAELTRESQHSLAFSRTRVNQWAIDLLEGGLKILEGLRETGSGPDQDPAWEPEYLAQVAAHQNIQVECIYKVNRAWALLLLGQCERARVWSDQADSLIYTVGTQGLLPWAEHVFVRALLLVRLMPEAQPEKQEAWRAELMRLCEQVRLWTHACPENFAHKQAMLAAEIARLDGHWTEALRRYREAVEQAALAGFVQWEGLANERAAAFLETCGEGRLAQAYWEEAFRCYAQWGATAKQCALETAYEEHLRPESPSRPRVPGPERCCEPELVEELWGESRRQLWSRSARVQRAQFEAALHRQAAELAEATEHLRKEVAQRKQVEAALRDNEQRMRLAVETTRVGIWEWDLNTNRIRWDPEMFRLYGLPPTANGCVSYDVWRSAVLAEDIELQEASLRDTVRRKGKGAREFRIRRAQDGAVRHIQAVETVRLNQAGDAEWVVGTNFDITERKEAEAALHRANLELEQRVAERTRKLAASEERLELALEAAQDGIWDWNMETNEVFYSPRWKTMLGYEESEIEHHVTAWKRLLHPEDLPRALEVVAGVLRGGREYVMEFRMRHKDGHYVEILSRGHPIHRDPGGPIVRIVGTHSDLTERKQAEEALRSAKEAAETANRAKSAFLANMSHEIRTPLNAILGFTQLLLRQQTGSPETHQRLEGILRGGEHLLHLIDDLLDMARIESGRLKLQLVTFDVVALVEDLERLFDPRARAKGLRFRVDRQAGLPRYLVADPTRLRQILINLLSNAVKFTPDGGAVTLRVGAQHEGQGVRVWAEVEDNGPGICGEDLGRLFRPFSQTDRGRQVSGGTGLGLAISRECARLMGAEITVNSQPGAGSTFRLEVPLAVGQADGVRATPADHRRVLHLGPGQPACRVLVVDDEAGNRELLEQTLGPIGFEVRSVGSGPEALRQCQEWTPRVVVLDLRMPGMDGHEVVRRLRAAHREAIKIVVLSATVLAEDQAQAHEAGADVFLGKPFLEGELLEEIRRLTGVEFLCQESPAANAGRMAERIGRDRPSAEAMRALPRDLVEGLRVATLQADYGQLLELAGQVADRDAHLGRQLRGLAERFEYETLESVLSASAPCQSVRTPTD
jgi:PAS domain S-box-containing protein